MISNFCLTNQTQAGAVVVKAVDLEIVFQRWTLKVSMLLERIRQQAMEWKDNIITHLKLAEAQTVSDNVAFHFCYDHKKVISGLHLKSDDTVHHAQQPITEEITQHRVWPIQKDQNSPRMILAALAALNLPLQWVILTEYLWPWP